MKARSEAPKEMPWIGTLIADWPLVPLRYLVRFLSGGTPDKGTADFWTGGTIPWVSPKDMKVDRINDSEDHITEAALESSATQLVPVGSVLVVVRGMILAHTLPVAVTTGPVTINQDIKALVCGSRILPEFLNAVLAGQSEWLLSQADSSAHGTKKLETEVLQRFEVPCPPIDLQRKIVSTMRAQAKDLDGVVAAKQRVLDLLAEKRKIIISTGVTRGLDPKEKLRDSGVPWLGEIPAHWKTARLKFLAAEPMAYGASEPSEFADHSHPRFIRITDISDDGSLREDTFRSLEPTVAAPYLLRRGDLLFARSGATVGKTFLFSGQEGSACFAGYLIRFRSDAERVLPEFIYAVAQSPYYWWCVHEGTIQATIQNFSAEKYGDIVMPIPPLTEQHSIVEHIARETAKLDTVRVATERTISLLKERRSALIAAAVSGQTNMEAV